jgi:hypothetical protein
MKFRAPLLTGLMVSLMFLICLRCAAQIKPTDYEAAWKRVDSLINQNDLPTTALEEVDKIYSMAKKERNEAQMIRALVYRIDFEDRGKENSPTQQLEEIDKEIANSTQPARSILQSILAGMYWQKLRANLSKFYGRTNTVGFVKDDVNTWTADDFHKKISALYLASLKEEKILREIRVDSYDPVVIPGNSRALRPTLFDLLAHEALDYFKNSESTITRPADNFELEDAAVFADEASFSKHSFKTDDTLSPHAVALGLFQRLIQMHQDDANPSALVDLDIERIKFAYDFGVMEDKDSLYMQALQGVTRRYPEDPAAAKAWYLQAEMYNEQADLSGRKDSAYRYGKVTAKAICEQIINQKDSSEGRVDCRSMLQQINGRVLFLRVEKINVPGKPMRALLTWKNVSSAWFRIVRVDQMREELLDYTSYSKGRELAEKIKSMPAVFSFSQALPETGDYLQHSAEIRIPSLPPGAYMVLASSGSGFGQEDKQWLSLFYVSSIAFIRQGRDYFIVNRESGLPLGGATVQVWGRSWDNRNREYSELKLDSGTSDTEGHFRIKEGMGRFTAVQLDVGVPGDHLFPVEQSYDYPTDMLKTDTSYTAEGYEQANVRSFLFTDRSIYRPGQEIYFKGIVVTQDFTTRQAKIWPGFKTKLFIQDANGTKVDSVDLVTNEFGSYHGKFRIPEHRLNGYWTFKDEAGTANQGFRVEEYKRPNFYVGFEKAKGSYRLGDSVTVKGFARAYAGNQLAGAQVKYSVSRSRRLQFVGMYRRIRFPSGGGVEIAHGTAKIGADGRFTLTFLAKPSREDDKKSNPSFNFEVTADVTDINGETRSGQTTLVAGYHALELDIDLPGDMEHLPADSLKGVGISLTNLDGEPVASNVKVRIYALAYPRRLIRARLWEEPDQFVIPVQEFLDSFPHDEYRHETKKESWVRGQRAFSGEIMTDSLAPVRNGDGIVEYGDGAILKIPAGSLSPGWWLVEAETQDPYGETVKVTRYVELTDTRTGMPPMPEYLWPQKKSPEVQPGDKVRVEIGSSAQSVYVLHVIERPGTLVLPGRLLTVHGPFTHFALDNNRKELIDSISEADRGGFSVEDAFVRDNRLYQQTTPVRVPWSNKMLHISYSSYRDKTLPGSGEKWQVKISGNNRDAVNAEVLTAMYDASLDQFYEHGWVLPNIYTQFTSARGWGGQSNFVLQPGQPVNFPSRPDRDTYIRIDDQLLLPVNLYFQSRHMKILSPAANSFQHDMNPDTRFGAAGQPGGDVIVHIRGTSSFAGEAFQENSVGYFGSRSFAANKNLVRDDVNFRGSAFQGAGTSLDPTEAPVQIRRNLQETAFFFPDLRTDTAGNISFSFTMPEALTRWKWLMMAHTKDAAFGYSEKEIVTQKKLMLTPNAPRFLREGDRMELSAKVANLADSELTGQMELQLVDATTGQTADGWFSNRQANQYFTVGAGQSAVVSFPIDIPYQYNRPLTFRLVARAHEFSDGEEATLPVVSNRMLVTETLPLNMPGDAEKNFVFEKLLKSGGSETLNHHAVTVEFTSNPAWYAVQALPYLAEYPYECAEQVFNRFYANALASKIANNSPRMRQIFERWRAQDTAALLSNLEKNQELKSILLEETPWVIQGKSESEQKRRIALLFDMTRMSGELESALDKLIGMQSDMGGFPWFKGGADDRYITQYILTGIGHLKQIDALPAALTEKIKVLVTKAMSFADDGIRRDYEDWKNRPPLTGGKSNTPVAQAKATGEQRKESGHLSGLGELQILYLYMRSLFNDRGIYGDVLPAVTYYRKESQRLWMQESRYMQGMIALALFRTGDIQTAKNIIASLKQNAVRDTDKGMYWKGMEGGYYWWEAPIEIESLMIEAFREIGGDAGIDRDLKTWLLRQKQTQDWGTTKATADACFALLSGKEDWLASRRDVEIRLGEKTASSFELRASSQIDEKNEKNGGNTGRAVDTSEAGTGYFKKVFDGPFVNASMGNITVKMRTLPDEAGVGKAADGGKMTGGGKAGAIGSPAWGAVYWQYFDNLDRITPTSGGKSPLSLSKKLFVERTSANGPVLEPIPENGYLHVGDKVRVRIELRADRNMEYVHMKDMRASCMEPVDVLSGYRWQGGLGYYQTTKDVSTEFFFAWLPQGTYVFEYSLFVGQTGNFSNGVTSIECMYAPEFADHSEGIRINVEEATAK